MTLPRRVGPTERMLTVLDRLRRDPLRTWHVDFLRKGVGGYEDTASGDRNWQFDSQALRARGLIKTGISTPATPRRTGVKYALPAKPDDLHLTVEEHAALVAARRAQGISGMPNPLAGDTPRGGPLETLAEALRRLEEQGNWTTVGDLARAMGQRPARLLKTLELAWCLDVDGRSVFDNRLSIDDDGELSAAQVLVCVLRRDDPEAPLRGRGLAVLGAGAYTLEEIADRLALIEDALAGDPPGDAAALKSARSKLLRWRQVLKTTLSVR